MKKQIWIEKGIIFKNLKLNWSKTHAMLPTVYKLKDNIFRVFFEQEIRKISQVLLF